MLTETQAHDLKALLDDRFYQVREAIHQELTKSDDQSYIELAGRVHDLEEESVADMLVDIQLASIDRHIKEVRSIDAALIRIAEGHYGVCIDCEEAIPYGRLKACLTAKRCQRCQTKYEETHAETAGSSL